MVKLMNLPCDILFVIFNFLNEKDNLIRVYYVNKRLCELCKKYYNNTELLKNLRIKYTRKRKVRIANSILNKLENINRIHIIIFYTLEYNHFYGGDTLSHFDFFNLPEGTFCLSYINNNGNKKKINLDLWNIMSWKLDNDHKYGYLVLLIEEYDLIKELISNNDIIINSSEMFELLNKMQSYSIKRFFNINNNNYLNSDYIKDSVKLSNILKQMLQ